MTRVIVPPCQAACPINTDVRGYVAALARGDAEDAIQIIRRVNPLPSVCGRICTRLCETACRRAKVDAPVAIRALKRFASDHTKHLVFSKQPLNSYSEKIAIIGSGPSGLTAAHDLALLGYAVTIFEAQPVLGGLLIEGIPNYRLPKEVVQKDIQDILTLGIEVRTGVALGTDFTIEGLLNTYEAVFIAVGSQKSLVPRCKGDDLPGVLSGFEFLKLIDRGQITPLGRKVLVIGGGHTAVDAARTSIRLGCPDVTVVYRRTIEEIPAGREDVEEAEQEGVKFIYCAAPVEFAGDGKVQRARFVKMALGEQDSSGRRRPVPISSSEFELDADAVILAIGYVPDVEDLRQDGLKLDAKGTIIVKDDTGITDIKGVFAAGDVVTGPMSVVDAMASGRKAAGAIHRYFRSMSDKPVDNRISLRPLDDAVAQLIHKSERQQAPVLPVEQRKRTFAEVDLGYDREQACREALRCLNCGAGALVDTNCAACLNCVRICPFGIPVTGKETAEIDISQCQACGICASECPACAIRLRDEGNDALLREIQQVLDRAREENPEKAVIGFYCIQNDPLGPPLDHAEIYWISRLCTGRLKESQLLYPFEAGADGVIMSMCPGDECRFLKGSHWVTEHVKRGRKILKETGIGEERLSIAADDEDYHEFLRTIETLGINPLRKGKKVGA
jgi:NADPH-dependent glutamate synthase beta subunit-like oxidoreductase/coenzyme F420-reducing hydrogenase delta subunit/Pyruvate/2-oxoacid:ferredoxin oxidoreductase delta subunit